MSGKKTVKVNLYAICVLLLVVSLAFVGVSYAYFTSARELSTTLTSGAVRITLSEAAVKADGSGDLVEDPASPRIVGKAGHEVVNDYGHVGPGMRIYKDPTITNTGTVPAWVAAKVTLTDGNGDLHRLMGYPGYDEIDIEQLLTGALLDETVHVREWNGIADVCVNDHYAMIQVSSHATGTYEFFFLILQPVDVGGSVTIFDEVVFDPMWSNAEMQELANLKIHVQAFGVQTYQLDSCLQAMVEAFPEHFPFDGDSK